jgi:NAD(P)-dependent dehydrogenase (short-subunit alcohol dehydrogenase family)
MPRTVLITGCSSGFGQLAALTLARRGDQVFATLRDLESPGAKLLRDTAETERLPLTVHRLDVTHPASVQEAVDEALQAAVRIDVLVNNAGFAYRAPIDALTDEELRQQFDTNVIGVARMVRAVLPAMRAQGAGTIVNVSSVLGTVTYPFEGAYSASKHALDAMSEAMRFELAPYGVKVFVVAPGVFATSFGANAKLGSRFGDEHPLRARYDDAVSKFFTSFQAGDPAEVVAAIADAIDRPDGPFHRFVGAEAAQVAGLYRQHDYDTFLAGLLSRIGVATS